jgi:hypothetical protein
MKRNLTHFAALLMALAFIQSTVHAAEPAISTAFTYQGRLNADGGPASGLYDFEFRLFGGETNATAVAGPASAGAVWVTNGAFQTTLDFGSGVFTGEERWLEIAVQCTACDGLPVTLSPRQRLTATPQALFALNAGGLATYSGAPLDITLNGQRVMRYQPATSPTLGFMPNIIGGVGSYVTTQNHGVTVAGGGYHDVEDESYFSTVSGGLSNWLARGTVFSVIAGGEGNQIQANARHAAILGGKANRIGPGGGSAIGGGVSNYVSPRAPVGDCRWVGETRLSGAAISSFRQSAAVSQLDRSLFFSHDHWRRSKQQRGPLHCRGDHRWR